MDKIKTSLPQMIASGTRQLTEAQLSAGSAPAAFRGCDEVTENLGTPLTVRRKIAIRASKAHLAFLSGLDTATPGPPQTATD